MTTFLEATGPLTWPLLLLAAAALWHALRYLVNGRAQHLLAASGAALVSLLLSGISLVTGFQYSVAAAAGREGGASLVLLGLAESLNGVLLALLTCLLATVVLSVGGYRSASASYRVATRDPDASLRGA